MFEAENKERNDLIAAEICGKLQYGLHVRLYNHYSDDIEDEYISYENINDIYEEFPFEDISPCLRLMKDMTLEENKKYYSTCRIIYEDKPNPATGHNDIKEIIPTWKSFDYLDSIHVDYRGLIEKGYAFHARKNMYK